MVKSDWQKLIHIRVHCEDIEKFINRFGCDYDTFINDRAYFNAVAMCVFQIGELSNALSPEFREKTKKDIPWDMIRGMRNWLAHSYGEVDSEILWATANNDIPMLKEFCIKKLS